ncbi:Esterase/lipase [Serratia fonticola AU-AP2C]|nr:Esterase/lipase [Serratia fonticola AU-AP2C]
MSQLQLNAILEQNEKNLPPENATPDELRSWWETAMAQIPVADVASIERLSLAGFSAEFLRPHGKYTDNLIIYAHGGGFVIGSSSTHRVITSYLAQISHSAVLVPDYRLAPENTAPAAHDDIFTAYCWALEQGYPARKIALAGDSAGGNLALATAVRAKAEGLPMPGALFLISPGLDLACEGTSHQEVTDDPFLTPQLLEFLFQSYVGIGGDLKSSHVTPFYADFSGLPPTLVHVGSWEMLRDDSVTVVERMREAGVDATLQIFDGMPHVWQLFAPILEEGMASLEQGAYFIQKHLHE